MDFGLLTVPRVARPGRPASSPTGRVDDSWLVAFVFLVRFVFFGLGAEGAAVKASRRRLVAPSFQREAQSWPA
jgi:hypothetical protein